MAIEKDGSKLVENSIKMFQHLNGKHAALKSQLYMVLDELIALPVSTYIYKENQHNNYVTFSDLLTNQFSNYVVQKCFDMSDHQRQQVIIDKAQYLVNYSHEAPETHFKHILKHFLKKGIEVKYNEMQVQQEN